MKNYPPCRDNHVKQIFGSFETLTFKPDPEVIKHFSCLTQLSIKFQLPIKTKMLKNKDFPCFQLSDVVFTMLINVKMPTLVGILTFMSMINLILS